MSTIALPEDFTKEDEALLQPTGWILHYEDGKDRHSERGVFWSDEATAERIDGILLPMTTRKVISLTLFPRSHPDTLFSLKLPEPLPVFGFTRWSQPLSSSQQQGPTWRYSAFGYVLPDSLLVVKVFPPIPGKPGSLLSIEQQMLKRPMTFPL